MVSTSIYIPVVILNVEDHSLRLELNNRSNCNFTHSWHMSKCELQFCHGHPLLPSFRSSHWWVIIPTSKPNNKSHCVKLFPNWCTETSKWEDWTHTSSSVLLPQCVKAQLVVPTLHLSDLTVNANWFDTCFHTLSVSKYFHRFSLWHSSWISHLLKVRLAIVTSSILYNSSHFLTFFISKYASTEYWLN